MPANRKQIVHLPLKQKWFDLIKNGEKRIEYRNCCSFWKKRLFRDELCQDPVPYAVFTLGYPGRKDDDRRIFAKVKMIDIGGCPYDGWEGSKFFRIHFDVVSKSEIPS